MNASSKMEGHLHDSANPYRIKRMPYQRPIRALSNLPFILWSAWM
jgi:hypothetical protein